MSRLKDNRDKFSKEFCNDPNTIEQTDRLYTMEQIDHQYAKQTDHQYAKQTDHQYTKQTDRLYTMEQTDHLYGEEQYLDETCETPAALIDDYRFIRLLGEGSSGKTYLALQRRNNARVAVKVLKIDSTYKGMELFEREAKTLSSICVPGVPEFYGYVKSKVNYGEAYLIQEYIDIPSLQFQLDDGKSFDEMEVIDIARNVCTILKHLETDYSPSIIHRDIKPSNIMYDRLNRVCYLIDFGAVANPQRKSMGSTVRGPWGLWHRNS